MIDFSAVEELAIARRLRELLRRWWGLELGLALADGYVASHARGRVVASRNSYCRAALGRADTFQACNRSVEQAIGAIAEAPGGAPRAVRVSTCHLHLPMLFVPLWRQDAMLGALFVSGFLVEGDDDARLTETEREAERLGLTAEATREGGPEVIRLTRRDYHLVCELLEALAEELLLWPGVVDALERHAGARVGDEGPMAFEAIVGQSAGMRRLYTLIERVAPSNSTVLITGEDGTGKELVAHAIHARSRRAERPFVIRNCSALNDNLLESELFGHVRGSFTGAERDRVGVFEQAHTGTLFLDEVGDTSTAMQVKLLRVLQDGVFVPVGGSKSVAVDVRVVAATNRPLPEMVAKGTFRKDLYYRLKVIQLTLPPLRERADDLPTLCETFLTALAERSGGPRKRLSPGVEARLQAHHWPGNIRELQSEMERLYVLSGDAVLIREEFLSPEVGRGDPPPLRARAGNKRLADAVAQVERDAISRALVRHDWNKSRVAEELDISRTTLLRKIQTYELGGPEVSRR